MSGTFDTQREAAGETPDREAARAAEVKDETLTDLARLRRVGMNFVERLDKRAAGAMDACELEGMKRVGDDCAAFERIARAVRQIVALEHETVGIRPMPQQRGADRGGKAADDPRSDDGADDDEEDRMWREALRTQSTRSTHNDLKDRPEKERARENAAIALVKERLSRNIRRMTEAAEADLAAAGALADAKRGSPWDRITLHIHRVPHPRFTACLEEMAADPDAAAFAATVRKHARPPPRKDADPPERRGAA